MALVDTFSYSLSQNQRPVSAPPGFENFQRTSNEDNDFGTFIKVHHKRTAKGSSPKSLSPQGARYRDELISQIREKEKSEYEHKLREQILMKKGIPTIIEAPIPLGQGFRYLFKDPDGKGDTYEGDWKDNKPHGYGLKRWKDGSYYQGEWVEGQQEGKGHAQFFSEDEFSRDGLIEGYWKGGSPIEGIFYFPESSEYRVYHGGFSNWQPSKEGILEYRDGKIYSGQMKNGKEEGFGRMSFTNGETYEGYFHAGKFCGWGRYTSVEYIYEGYWFLNKFHGFGTIDYKGGDWYAGYFDMGAYHGKGIYEKYKYIECKWDKGNPIVYPIMRNVYNPRVPNMLKNATKVCYSGIYKGGKWKRS